MCKRRGARSAIAGKALPPEPPLFSENKRFEANDVEIHLYPEQEYMNVEHCGIVSCSSCMVVRKSGLEMLLSRGR